MSRTSAWVKCVDRWGRRKTKLTLLRGAVDALHWDWWAVAFYVNPNRSLDRYCAICYREYNFLPSFIFLLASCCFNISIPQYSSSSLTRARYLGVLSFLLSHLSQVGCNVLRTWCLWRFLNSCLENVPSVAYFGSEYSWLKVLLKMILQAIPVTFSVTFSVTFAVTFAVTWWLLKV